ncbi:hypothetical protein Hypma_001221 [Hypsizygus marmoreus]|uniref:Uncharacterized protein n=1 Tax=Hypsizygus marmoreus TaxID=39966 RepID=A0A369J7W0_HYPMA|nr:hypothetical protein Hypma_001221 [Hypsizygus marmoreus]
MNAQVPSQVSSFPDVFELEGGVLAESQMPCNHDSWRAMTGSSGLSSSSPTSWWNEYRGIHPSDHSNRVLDTYVTLLRSMTFQPLHWRG